MRFRRSSARIPINWARSRTYRFTEFSPVKRQAFMESWANG